MEEIKKGSKVIDNEGETGTVTYMTDKHNIHVEYDNNKGSGWYCTVKGCHLYEDLRVNPTEGKR